MKTRRILLIFPIIIASLFLATNFNIVRAATPTPTPKATSSAVNDAEIERIKQLTKELSLNIPDQTEDPNYPVTFVDPSKQGVEITVDDKAGAKAASPYLLPNLSIGEHKLIFKFKNKDGIVRVLTKDILVTPKAPQFDATLKTEVVKPNSVTIKGSALPLSSILLVVNSTDTHKFSANTEGKWEFILPDPEFGANNVIAFAIKEGIVSSPSKTFTVQYKETGASTNTDADTGKKESQILVTLRRLVENINANRLERPAIFYGAIAGAVIVVLLLVDLQLRKRAAKKRDEKTIATLFGNLQTEGGSIVDAIQSVKDAVTKKKKKGTVDEPNTESPPAIKKALAELQEDKEIEAEKPAVTTPSQTTLPSEVESKTTKKPGKKLKKKSTATVATAEIKTAPVVSKPLAEEKPAEEVSLETEEPEKKVLTKEEFLKQFQKGGEQDE